MLGILQQLTINDFVRLLLAAGNSLSNILKRKYKLMGCLKTNLGVDSQMRHRDDDWRDLGVLVLELSGLEHIVIIETIAEAFLEISLRSQYNNLFEGPVLLSFPESLKLLIILFSLDFSIIVSFAGLKLLLSFELHIKKNLRYVEMNLIYVFYSTRVPCVSILSSQLVHGVEY